MTGYDLYKRCMALMGYVTSSDEAISDHTLISRFTEIINQVALDLKIPPIGTLSEEISISEAKKDALCYGAAMVLSFSEGDMTKNQFFTKIYNSKRSIALSEVTKISDILPSVGSGGI